MLVVHRKGDDAGSENDYANQQAPHTEPVDEAEQDHIDRRKDDGQRDKCHHPIWNGELSHLGFLLDCEQSRLVLSLTTGSTSSSSLSLGTFDLSKLGLQIFLRQHLLTGTL